MIIWLAIITIDCFQVLVIALDGSDRMVSFVVIVYLIVSNLRDVQDWAGFQVF